jgi:HSP20 family molecular chaperone IbpA
MAEEFRDDQKLVFMADVPGLRADEEISVSIASGVLHIRAGRSDGAGVPGSDLREGGFTRSIRLPSGTDEWNVTASYDDGVLAVRAPMQSHSVCTRSVPITSSEPKPPS